MHGSVYAKSFPYTSQVFTLTHEALWDLAPKQPPCLPPHPTVPRPQPALSAPHAHSTPQSPIPWARQAHSAWAWLGLVPLPELLFPQRSTQLSPPLPSGSANRVATSEAFPGHLVYTCDPLPERFLSFLPFLPYPPLHSLPLNRNVFCSFTVFAVCPSTTGRGF